ncbi:MAG: Zn-dependent hydrolase [Rhodobacteraceae bacterium HLUCCA12]|nr:MAG: Zn-dependent hydrolase [Rhodobacteraceae bacterium HLUCCA12]
MTETVPAPIVDAATRHEIASGVFVIPDHRVPLVPNIGIVLGEHTALVVDTGMGPRNGAAVLDAAQALAGDRRLVLTLTHFHPEHGFGAAPFKGKAHILYNRAQGEDLATKGMGYLEMFRGMAPEIAEALDGTELVAADTLYDGAVHEIDLGGRKAVLRNWGMAHTRGDQIIWLPDTGVLFTGDLAEERTFPIFPWFPPDDTDINAANWIKALTDCMALNPKIVVPGHGEIGGVKIVDDVRRYIETVGAKVAAAKAAGKDAEAIVAELEPQIRAAHPDWHFPEWIGFAIRYHIDTQP